MREETKHIQYQNLPGTAKEKADTGQLPSSTHKDPKDRKRTKTKTQGAVKITATKTKGEVKKKPHFTVHIQ